jgi:transglutaminase superfamily protein
MDLLRSIPRRAAKFARLRPADRWLFLRIFTALVRVRLALWFRPFDRVREYAGRLGEKRVPDMSDRLSAHDLTSLVTVAACYIPRATCLTQALVADALLRRYGYAPELKIGVGRDDNRFQAHAWVEIDGKVVIGDLPALDQYTPLPTPTDGAQRVKPG